MAYAPGTNTGHGWVWERPDRLKARCGGPNICKECSADMPPLASLMHPDVYKQLNLAKDKRIADLEAALTEIRDLLPIEHDNYSRRILRIAANVLEPESR